MTRDIDPAIRIAPTGEAIDGRRLLAESVGFGRALRAAGLHVDLAAAIDFSRAIGLIDVSERETVREVGAAVFVRRRDDRPTYDRVFDRFWRRRGRKLPGGPPELGAAPDAEREDGTPGPAEQPGEGEGRGEDQPSPFAVQTGGDSEGDAPIEGVTISPDAYSAGEVLRHRDFDRMTVQELRDAERFVDLLTPRLELRRTRRHELHPHGRRIAPRAMFRRSLGTGGEITSWVWRRPIKRPRQLVVLCDISGSMERHSRLLLRFVQALARTKEVRAESFVFGTRLTRVTRLLKDRDRDRALARVADSVNDWAGGTRIGESFREFNHRWARRTLRTSGVVIVVSDGWDRGDPNLVAAETARLRRNCHRLVWLNPLASAPGYQPLAAGMRAAYPFIDDFVPAGTLASLERLGEILAGASTGSRIAGRAVTAATTVSPSAGLAGFSGLAGAAHGDLVRPPATIDGTHDPTTARPLT
ncbi:MAG TPA: VWA domain-containing protein [Candidatus Limnocylindrales bacterium]|nr:VWA domain-containing protein [Candidatus Limnocylindrales bacterium]